MPIQLEQVRERLRSLSYEPTEEDGFSLGLAIARTEERIRNACNVPDIPEGLTATAVDMACGAFLSGKYQAGKLEGFDLGQAVKSIHLGDSQVTYATENAPTVAGLLAYLSNERGEGLACFRRIKW